MKILLVDDELPIRSYLKTLVDWEGHGYELVEAENGEAALERLKEGGIHLVLLDITMPVMSGLDVLEWITENGIRAVVTLLTSHDEFSYVQKALRLSCFDYVLKNDMTSDSILALVERMRNELSEEQQQEQRLYALETAERRKSQRELQESINYWLCGLGVHDENAIKRLRTQLSFDDNKCRYVLLEIAIADYEAVVHRYAGSDIVHFSRVFDGVLNELLEEHTFFFTEPQEGVFLVFLCFSRQENVQKILGCTQALSAQIDASFRNLLSIHSSIIYTLPYSFIKESRERYHKIELLRPHVFFQPCDGIYCLDDYNLDAAACDIFLRNFEQIFSEKLDSRNILEIELYFDDAVRRIVEQHFCVDPTNFTHCCERCVAYFLSSRVGEKHQLRTAAPYASCATLKEALLLALRPHCISNEDQDKNLLIKKALLLIQQHYSEDIGLEWMAEKLWVNASYLSRIFSQEVGQPFTPYLSNYRIEQAKRLISTSNLKLYEIAEQTGFSSSIVFSSSFKKVTGKTPSEFRNGAL